MVIQEEYLSLKADIYSSGIKSPHRILDSKEYCKYKSEMGISSSARGIYENIELQEKIDHSNNIVNDRINLSTRSGGISRTPTPGLLEHQNTGTNKQNLAPRKHNISVKIPFPSPTSCIPFNSHHENPNNDLQRNLTETSPTLLLNVESSARSIISGHDGQEGFGEQKSYEGGEQGLREIMRTTSQGYLRGTKQRNEEGRFMKSNPQKRTDSFDHRRIKSQSETIKVHRKYIFT